MMTTLVSRLSALIVSIVFMALHQGLASEVSVTPLSDRIRIEIDGALFTEWRFADWSAPYLYPVIGPNGVSVTRHFPMKEGVPGEQDDHPHHRSIRFSHRMVDGLSFWAPDAKQGGHETRIELDEILETVSGETGKVVLRNRWLGDEELVLLETVTLRFIPLANREVLMDFDIVLMSPNRDVTFEDEKDGGLSVRVAGSMKVEDRKSKEGRGTIEDSKGRKNSEAWGERAEWCDYSGPDESGKTVGIAIFDHPDNLRFPTHWHARTYGLMAANRFGTGYFDAEKGAAKGSGDYVIRKGEALSLRHRFYLHHGDATEADVAGQWEAYALDRK